MQTILIVDDTPANLALVVECLEDRGFRVVIAQDGEEGLRRAELVRPSSSCSMWLCRAWTGSKPAGA